MEGGKVNQFFVGAAPGLSLTGDVTCEDSASIFGVSYFGTNGHKINSGYFELGGASFDCTDLTIGPDTNIVTTTPDHNGGNITIEPARGATVILNSGGSMTPAEGGSVIIRAYPGIHNGGIHVIAPSSGGAKETFNGQTIFEASSLNQSVRIDKNVELVCTNKLFINTPETVLNGTISCKETTYTYEPALSGGTIACSEGALDLSKLHSLTFTGQNLTILSASDITDAGASLAIDVSSFKGSGGKLNLIAGFDFVPHRSAGVEGNLDITTDYAISPIQRGAGAIKLSNTVINVSGAKASGGVFGYARGPILLKSITAIGNTQRQSFPSVAQSSGGVTLIGEGVTVERINTSGDNSAWSSRVSITSASPKTSGNVTVTAGLLAGGSFVPDIYQGSISPGAIGVDLGTVLLDASAADGSIVGGQIRSSRLVCKSGSGGIGTSANPVQLLSGNLVTANAGTAGDVYLNAESIWLLDENSGKDFFINTSAGAIEVGRNSRIFGQHSINLDSSGKFSMVKMQYGGALIEAPLLNLTTSGGAIGGAPAIRVKASRIRVTGPADRAQVHIVNLDPKGVLSFGVKPAKDGGKKLRHAEGVRRF